MSKIKKILGVLFALVLLLTSVGVNKSFAEENKGSITVNGAETDKEYQAYKIFDLKLSEDSSNFSYTISDEWKDFFTTGSGNKYIVDQNTGSLNPIVVDNKVKYINITDQNVAEFAKEAMGQMSGKTVSQTAKAANKTAKFTNLALGYYMVYPKGASETKEGQTSIVSLTSTKPSGEVDVKATYPTIEKTADKKSADYGEKISFTIAGLVPDSTGYNKYDYVLKDSLPKGLTIDQNSIKVNIGGAEQTANITKTVDGQNLTLTLNILGLVKDNNVKAGEEIKVTYDTTLNKEFTLGSGGEENKAVVEFPNDPKNAESKDKTPESKVRVYSGKIKVVKHATGDENKLLKGAKFVLKNSEGKFYNLENGVVSWKDEQKDASELESKEDGTLEFTGIKAGAYSLVETEAPKGYNLKTDPTEVTLKDTPEGEDSTVTMELTSTIENSTGVELPGTGGAGTKMFALVGGAVILFAGFTLLKGKLKFQER